MGQQEYDFFATGQPEPVAPPVPPPAPRRQQFTDPSGRAVNQFGTPVEADAAPAGPMAAPGYGAQTYRGHGLTEAQWTPPAPPLPPGAYVQDTSERPGTVLAAGIIGIVVGALAGVAGLFMLFAGAAVQSSLDELGGSLGAVFYFVAMIVLAVAVLYVVAGIGTVRGRRWAAWTLLVVAAVALSLGLLDLLTGSAGGGVVGMLVEAAIVVLLLLPGSRAWLQRR